MENKKKIKNIQESNQSLDGKNVQVPKSVLKSLEGNKQMLANRYQQIGDDSYKKSDGYKRNQRITNNGYNDRKEGNERKKGTISYNDLVKWNYDFDHMPKGKDSIPYQLNGGKEAEMFVKNSLSQMRNAVKPENKVKKSENISKDRSLKPQSNPMKPIKVDNADVHIHEHIMKIVEERLNLIIEDLKKKNN